MRCPLQVWSRVLNLTAPLLLPRRRRQGRVGGGAGVPAEGGGARCPGALSRGSNRWSAALRAPPPGGGPEQVDSERLRLVQWLLCWGFFVPWALQQCDVEPALCSEQAPATRSCCKTTDCRRHGALFLPLNKTYAVQCSAVAPKFNSNPFPAVLIQQCGSKMFNFAKCVCVLMFSVVSCSSSGLSPDCGCKNTQSCQMILKMFINSQSDFVLLTLWK